MYFLLNTGIFQPAMLVYQRVVWTFVVFGLFSLLKNHLASQKCRQPLFFEGFFNSFVVDLWEARHRFRFCLKLGFDFQPLPSVLPIRGSGGLACEKMLRTRYIQGLFFLVFWPPLVLTWAFFMPTPLLGVETSNNYVLVLGACWKGAKVLRFYGCWGYLDQIPQNHRHPGEYLLRFGVWMVCFWGSNTKPQEVALDV